MILSGQMNVKKLAKQLITSDNVLTHYEPSLELKLSCDTSNVGIGAVLSCVLANGEERPVTFISRTQIN